MGILSFNKQNGQTLIETIVALTAAVVVLGAISVVVASSINNATFLSSQNLAGKYASQGIDFLRYIQKTNPGQFLGFVDPTTKYCMPEDATTKNPVIPATGNNAPCQVNVGGSFKREFMVRLGSSSDLKCSSSASINEYEVTVNVYWTSGKCPASGSTYCHVSTLSSCFSSANSPLPTP